MAPESYQSTLPPPTGPAPGHDGNTDPESLHSCPFCRIAKRYLPFDPAHPPTNPEPATATPPDLTGGHPTSHVLLSTPLLIAFLDIQPLSRGHLLLCPRRHAPKLTHATGEESRELGFYLRILSAALSRVTGVEDWNVVQNNGAAASQVVPHLHFHIIPRPEIRAQGRWSEKFTMFGKGQREELDDDDAETLARDVRSAIADVLKEDELSTAPRGKL